MPRVLVVCTANVCRSPVVEALLRDHLRNHGMSEWHISSAGTWADPGQKASRYGVQLMAEKGLDISQHTAREVTGSMLTEVDLVLCMEAGHAEALGAEFPEHRPKIYLLSEMAGQRHDIQDPVGGPREAYERMVEEVNVLLETGLSRIIELAQTDANVRHDG